MHRLHRNERIRNLFSSMASKTVDLLNVSRFLMFGILNMLGKSVPALCRVVDCRRFSRNSHGDLEKEP